MCAVNSTNTKKNQATGKTVNFNHKFLKRKKRRKTKIRDTMENKNQNLYKDQEKRRRRKSTQIIFFNQEKEEQQKTYHISLNTYQLPPTTFL